MQLVLAEGGEMSVWGSRRYNILNVSVTRHYDDFGNPRNGPWSWPVVDVSFLSFNGSFSFFPLNLKRWSIHRRTHSVSVMNPLGDLWVEWGAIRNLLEPQYYGVGESDWDYHLAWKRSKRRKKIHNAIARFIPARSQVQRKGLPAYEESHS